MNTIIKMANLEETDSEFFQRFLETNGEIGVVELEMKIKEYEDLEQYERCEFLSQQIEQYYKGLDVNK
jgi:hypothetical protein